MLATLILTTCLAAADAEPAKGVNAAELKKLQGKWQVTSVENGGKKSPAKEVANLTLEITKLRMVTRDGIEVKEEAEITLLDPKAKPGNINAKITGGLDTDKKVEGIWKLDGDTLTICMAEPGKIRPTMFVTKEGSGLTLFVFKKIKPE